MVTGFYYSFYLVVAIVICAAITCHGVMTVVVSVSPIVAVDVNANLIADVCVNVSQTVDVIIREELYFLIQYHHITAVIADVVMTLVSQEDFLQVQQPVVVKTRIDDVREDEGLRRFFRLISLWEW